MSRGERLSAAGDDDQDRGYREQAGEHQHGHSNGLGGKTVSTLKRRYLVERNGQDRIGIVAGTLGFLPSPDAVCLDDRYGHGSTGCQSEAPGVPPQTLEPRRDTGRITVSVEPLDTRVRCERCPSIRCPASKQ